MRILDVQGNEIIQRPDFTKGRYIPTEDPNVLVYATWTEIPDVDDQGNVIDHSVSPSLEATLNSLQEDINITQLALTEVFELLSEV